MPTHTPTPWRTFDGVYIAHGECNPDSDVADCNCAGLPYGQREANALRIVQCVNACAGIEGDPQEALQAARDALAMLMAKLQDGYNSKAYLSACRALVLLGGDEAHSAQTAIDKDARDASTVRMKVEGDTK